MSAPSALVLPLHSVPEPASGELDDAIGPEPPTPLSVKAPGRSLLSSAAPSPAVLERAASIISSPRARAVSTAAAGERGGAFSFDLAANTAAPAAPAGTAASAAPDATTSGSAATMNSLASAAPSADKLAKLSSDAPQEESEARVFDKTLASDVTQDEAVHLLQALDEKTSLFREFTLSDMSYLAQVLTILKFAPGDTIIEAGEESSFVGVVLQGVLQVSFGKAPDIVKKPIPEGSLLGELSFFEGGTRTAAVSSQGESIVGMITFNELELLAEYAPTIRLKLIVLFALEGIKKMRMFNKPPAPAASVTEEEKKQETPQVIAPYNAKPPINKRGTAAAGSFGLIASAVTGNAAGAAPALGEGGARISPSASVAALPPSGLPPTVPGHSRRSSVRGGGSTGKEQLAQLPAGSLNDKAAPVAAAAGTPATAAAGPSDGETQSRTVEALFRIRMRASEKTQQEKIEKALEKRKRAEHKAYTSTVMADAFKRELDKKQEFIEELYQENLDLREYKVWAQKKHAVDAKSYKDKCESYAELNVALNMEKDRRIAQEKANEELYSKLETMVLDRTRSYEETIAQLKNEVAQALAKVEAGVKAAALVEENMRAQSLAHAAAETKLSEEIKALESLRQSESALAHEQVQHWQRQMYLTVDELATNRRALTSMEEKLQNVVQAHDALQENLSHKDLLHARVHRHLLATVDKHSTLARDLDAYKCILKYLLASLLIKTVRRRKYLRALYTDHTELTTRIAKEVAAENHAAAAAAQSNGNNGPEAEDADTGSSSSSMQQSHRSTRAFVQSASPDTLLSALQHDLMPPLRSLVEEVCSQRLSARSMADSFFQRTIELKQQLLELERKSGWKVDALSQFAPGQEYDSKDGSDQSRAGTAKSTQHFLLLPSGAKRGGGAASARTASADPPQRSCGGGAGDFSDDDDADLQPHPPSSDSRGAKFSKRRASSGDAFRGDADAHASSGGAQSVAEQKDLRARMVHYKSKCKQFRETNAMLSTRAHGLLERVKELEEWQRSVYNAQLGLGGSGGAQQQQQQQQMGRLSPLPPPHQQQPAQCTGTLLSPLPPVNGAFTSASIQLKLGGSGIKQPPSGQPASNLRSAPHQRFASAGDQPQQQQQQQQQQQLASYFPDHRSTTPTPPAAAPAGTITLRPHSGPHYQHAVFGQTPPQQQQAQQTQHAPPAHAPAKDGSLFQIRGPAPQAQQASFVIQPNTSASFAQQSSTYTMQPHPPAAHAQHGATGAANSAAPAGGPAGKAMNPFAGSLATAPPLLVFPPSTPPLSHAQQQGQQQQQQQYQRRA